MIYNESNQKKFYLFHGASWTTGNLQSIKIGQIM